MFLFLLMYSIEMYETHIKNQISFSNVKYTIETKSALNYIYSLLHFRNIKKALVKIKEFVNYTVKAHNLGNM